ncbi:hypothetical protein GFD25_05440 [Bifidobacterium aerophilum]|uniref:Uncharacterized protein n=1 Tax=Bifidobacterium aerophilum TaxID=1798155 RepID=A0A6N9Z4B4_9BIFI|nr:hypothetical protein [Bifidobacterium aerophilum]
MPGAASLIAASSLIDANIPVPKQRNPGGVTAGERKEREEERFQLSGTAAVPVQLLLTVIM